MTELAAAAIPMFAAEKFAGMIAFLEGPSVPSDAEEQAPERVERELRYEEEAGDKGRGRRTTVRRLGTLLGRKRKRERAICNRRQEQFGPTVRGRSSPETGAIGLREGPAPVGTRE